MQHHTHTPAPRFYINSRGMLIDRQAVGVAQRTGYSMAVSRASRTDMQILADMLNEPEHMAEWDAGAAPDQNWSRRMAEHETHERLLLLDPGYRRLHEEVRHAA